MTDKEYYDHLQDKIKQRDNLKERERQLMRFPFLSIRHHVELGTIRDQIKCLDIVLNTRIAKETLERGGK